MRVTKVIREYIEAEVEKRIEPKYAEEEAEAKRQDSLLSEFHEGAAHAAEQAYLAYCNEHFAEISDFCELNITDSYNLPHFYCSRTATITNKCYTNNVHNWRNRMRAEAREIVKNIIVTLELGGSRAELEKMLSEL